MIKKFFKKISQKIKKIRLINKLNYNETTNIIRLGSDYGGWAFLDNEDLYNATIISAGLGEDASFDIEFINKYNGRVISVDPTPRSISYYKKIINKKGSSRKYLYSDSGVQKIESYDLKLINEKNFILIQKALYSKDNSLLKFYKPKNLNNVSHSIVNSFNDEISKVDYITTETITLKNIIENFKINNLALLKLDIEGAEISVIESMLQNKIFPKQLCVEFDILTEITNKTVEKFFAVHDNLIKSNYQLTKANIFPNMLYLFKD